MSYDFTRLTSSQKELLTFGGWTIGCGRPQPSKKAVQKLVERGLVVQRQSADSRAWPTIQVFEYSVPISVHMAWCERCSKLVDRKETKQ